ncbi:serine hydrolase [Actinoplanes sp. NPDC051851]|uniref:serine hydrolase domain-containing protein n=1 Tax=Actinoplanes sp. NPDC051851 TaxID=3154753 RepID=UPI0034365919
MTDDLLDAFVHANREKNLGAYGIHLHREGHDPLERRFRSDDRVNLYSVSKTFTAVAAGLAEAEGRLSLDDRVLDHLPELRTIAADGFAEVTLRQLITMTSGSSHEWFTYQPIEVPDLLHAFVAAPMAAAPGGSFLYTGSGPYAIGRVIARVTGADLRAYLQPRLFAPLGLHHPGWHTCPLGFPLAESDLFLTTGELARFGRLLLQGGEWEGRRIIPAAFVERIPAESVDTSSVTDDVHYGSGYGLGVWLGRDGTYRMDGKYGQFVVVDPRRRAVVTVTAHTEQDDALLDALYDLVLSGID